MGTCNVAKFNFAIPGSYNHGFYSVLEASKNELFVQVINKVAKTASFYTMFNVHVLFRKRLSKYS